MGISVDSFIEAREVVNIVRQGSLELTVLNGLSFDVRSGEWLAVLAPKGSGKTTLFEILAGLELPTSGQVRVGEYSLQELNEAARAKYRHAQVGLVSPELALVPQLTLLENVALPLMLEQPRNKALLRAQELLSMMDLSNPERLPQDATKLECEEAALARATITSPALLLIDDLAVALDSLETETYLQLLQNLRQPSLTIVSTTSEARVASHADRVLGLKQGKLVDMGA